MHFVVERIYHMVPLGSISLLAAFRAWHSRHTPCRASRLVPPQVMPCFVSCLELSRTTHLASFLALLVHVLPRFALGSLSHLAAFRAWHSRHTPCRALRFVPSHALLRFALGTLPHDTLRLIYCLASPASGLVTFRACVSLAFPVSTRLAAFRAWFPLTPCCVSR